MSSVEHAGELLIVAPVDLIEPPQTEREAALLRQSADWALYLAGLNTALTQSHEEKAELSANERIQRQRAEIDKLTGLRSQGAFEEEFPQYVEIAQSGSGNLAAIFLDLDNFGLVNKRHGDAAGDTLLRRAGEVLVGVVRAGDRVYRKGGDELVVLMPNFGSERDFDGDELMAKANRAGGKIGDDIRYVIKSLNFDSDLHVGVSSGVGILRPRESAERFLKRISDDMFRNKVERRLQLGLDVSAYNAY